MKRIRHVAAQSIVLISLCIFLGWQLVAPHNARRLRDKVQNIGFPYSRPETTKPSHSPVFTENPAFSSDPASSSSDSGTTLSAGHPQPPHAAGAGSRLSDGPKQKEDALEEEAASAEDDQVPELQVPELHQGDAELLREAPRYVQAILDPDDTSFPRLECDLPTPGRYDHLRPKVTPDHLPHHHRSAPNKIKYFFALDLYESAPLLPRLLGSVVETIRFLGPSNCALSIVEGRSKDGTYEILKTLQPELDRLPLLHYLSTNPSNPLANDGDRIEALATLRNQALAPMFSRPDLYDPSDTTILFLNDIVLCPSDLLELVHQRTIQKADMVCALDWISEGSFFYDVWIARSMVGDLFFEVPQSSAWDFATNLFWNHPRSKTRLDANQPIQVFSCWNGAAVFTAQPMLERGVRFRRNRHEVGECYMGEPTLLCKDFWWEGFGRIAVVPTVNVAYSDEQARLTKEKHGYVGQLLNRSTDDPDPPATEAVSELIQWDDEPPPMIKCYTDIKQQMWVRVFEGLGKKEH